MKIELGKASEGHDSLDRARDRLDTRVAEIGQAKLDRQEDEQKVDQASVQEGNVEGYVEQAEETAPILFPALREMPQSHRDSMFPEGECLPRGKTGVTMWKRILKTKDQDREARQYHIELTLSQRDPTWTTERSTCSTTTTRRYSWHRS